MDDQVEKSGVDVADAAGPAVAETQQPEAEVRQDSVPVAALQAERKERQQLQEQLKMLQDHVSLLHANQAAVQKQPENTLSDDDVLTVGEAKKFLSKMEQNYQMSVEELRVQQKYSDYNDVVSKYLPEVINKNPALKSTLQNDPNRYELAYFLAKNGDTYRDDNKKTKRSADAQRMVENSTKTGNLSSIGSNAPKSQVSTFKSMSDEDFMKFANKNLGYF